MDSINLIGAEEVSRASSRMVSAADTMSQAASSIDHSNEMFLRRFEELVTRQELAAEKMANAADKIASTNQKSIFERVFGK